MKIVFIHRVAPPYYSGAGRVMFNFARRLARQGHRITFLTTRFDQEVAACETVEGVAVRRFPAYSTRHVPYRLAPLFFHLQCAFWLLRHLRACDVIQFGYMPLFLHPVAWLARLFRRPLFIRMTLFGSDDLDSISRIPYAAVWMRSIRHVDGIVATTSQLIDASACHLPDPEALHYIPNPVDLTVFYPAANPEAKADLRCQFGIDPQAKVVIFVGGILHRKGFDLLVEAWASVLSVFPDARLYAIGVQTSNSKEYGWDNTKFIAEIEKRIETLGIGHSIVFTGHLSQTVPEYLRMADVFVLPSRQEGLPNAVLEAMASGLPCVLCKQPWLPPDFIRDHETGIICEPTPEAIAGAVNFLLGKPDQVKSIGQAALENVRETYDLDLLSGKLCEAYQNALNALKRPGKKLKN